MSREVIGQAQGILMERDRVSAEQAFDILRRASRRLKRRKFWDVTQNLVETGESPKTGDDEYEHRVSDGRLPEAHPTLAGRARSGSQTDLRRGSDAHRDH